MSKQPQPTDFIELWVEDDGDIILCKRPEPSDEGPASRITYPSGNLCYGVNDADMEELAAELYSYGCDKPTLKKAILAVTFAEYGEEVIAK